jgi:hypothetical protein
MSSRTRNAQGPAGAEGGVGETVHPENALYRHATIASRRDSGGDVPQRLPRLDDDGGRWMCGRRGSVRGRRKGRAADRERTEEGKDAGEHDQHPTTVGEPQRLAGIAGAAGHPPARPTRAHVRAGWSRGPRAHHPRAALRWPAELPSGDATRPRSRRAARTRTSRGRQPRAGPLGRDAAEASLAGRALCSARVDAAGDLRSECGRRHQRPFLRMNVRLPFYHDDTTETRHVRTRV